MNPTQRISIIVAVDKNWLIGKRGGLPWRLPADLRHFRELTTGNMVIMGRKTYDSIGRPLPNRTNIVISRNPDLKIPDCIMAESAEEALRVASGDHEIFIMGGAEIYNQFLPIAQRIYLTQVHQQFDGDIFFPEFDPSEWIETERHDFKADDKNPYDYSFLILDKTRK